MMDFYYILNTVVVMLSAYFWSKEGIANNFVKFILWVIFIINLLVTLNHFGVLIFGKIPLV